MINSRLSCGLHGLGWFLISMVFFFNGCAASQPQRNEAADQVRVVTIDQVQGCKYLGKVTAAVELGNPSDFIGLMGGGGDKQCQEGCIAKAAAKGATHLVWDKRQSDLAVARIYQCKP